MTRTSFSTEGSGSLQLHQPPTQSKEPYEDTALPQVTSQQLVLSRHRPLRGSESSILAIHLRGNQRTPPTWQYAHGSIGNSSNGHRRTGSTLKTVMRKIFNRRRRGETDSAGDNTPESLTPKSQSPRLYKGEADVPLGFRDLRPPQSVSPFGHENDRLHMRTPEPSYRRRATLPSLIVSEDGDGYGDAFPSLFTPGNVRYTKERRGSLANSDQTDLYRHETLLQSKRRSRSAGALRTIAKEHQMSPIQWRRRSTETTYVNSLHFDTVSDSEVSYRPPTSTTLASEQNPASEPPIQEVMQTDKLQDVAPDIGNFVNCMQHSEDVSLEQRLTTLEVKLIDLEFAIARMQNARTETPSSAAQAPKELKHSSSLSKSRRPPRRDSLAHFAPSRDESSSNDKHSSVDRPLSNTTIRPTNLHRSRTIQTPPSSSAKDFSAISVDQYSALVMLLRREQSARRNLEDQVAGLRQDIQQLQRLAQNSIPVHPAHTVHSKDSQDCIRLQQTLVGYPADSLASSHKFGSPYDTDSDGAGQPTYARDDVFGRPKWRYNQRAEVAGMI